VKLDDVVSLIIAVAVSALFAERTIATWPNVPDFRRFQTVYENPFTGAIQALRTEHRNYALRDDKRMPN
jgi:hypothetical protein